MTVEEVASTYGTQLYTINSGDTLLSVVDKIYDERSDAAILSLISLNHRFDWFNLAPGDTLSYLPKNSLRFVNEVTYKQ